MPTYDFRCRTCDAAFEVSRGLADDSVVACPQGHAAASRVFTPVSVGGTASDPGSAGGCCGGGCCG